MASSSSSPSLPVLSSQSWNYDVFLSFRGVDTRKTFVDHLYKALDQNGIHTYKDDVTLPRGESINPTLLKAIEESQIAVIIFSKNYANSTWCLDELIHIMKRKEEGKQIVMPIFYNVEPWEVRNQKRAYEDAFTKHELANKENVESWRKALLDASNIAGWETKLISNGYEAEGIEQIVEEILLRLNLKPSGANEKLVGIMTRVQYLKSELQIESGGVCMIGIWGVGGGGKTTLASSIFDEISSMYNGCCFVKNIREESRKIGLEKLQEKLLSDIFKQKQIQTVRRVEEGRRMIKARLHHRKVLIVLDDVDEGDQLEALVGSRDWFGKGSRIIITTRDEQILDVHEVDVIHQISLLNNDEAVRLFGKHAHRDRTPTEDFVKLSKEVVSYAGGLPLALKVLGSFLCSRNSMQWRSALDKLRDIPHKDIIGILRISFDGLEQDEKDLFLDIACCFRWKFTYHVMKLLDACGLHPVIGVEVLRQKALIVITENGYFDMHDLVQEMGQYIVRREHPKNPEKHSRLWKREDVHRIFDIGATMELDNIEAIDLRGLSYEESQRFLHVAGNMNKIRWIDLLCDETNNEVRDENIVPLPVNFPPPQLCCLWLRSSFYHKQLWEGYKYLPNLTHMELHDMPNLITIPDFAGLPKLETFKLERCPCLQEIHPSIGRLESLVYISIQLCGCLWRFPPITRIKKLETLKFRWCMKLKMISEYLDNLPHYNLNHTRLQFSHSTLKKLDLAGCVGDEKIASGFLELANLEELNLTYNSVSRFDFIRVPRLKWLNVSWCKHLVELSNLPPSILVVLANGCSSLESFGDLSKCKWLWNVSIRGKNTLDQHHNDTLIRSMLEGNASEDHFISVALDQHQLPNELIGRLFRRKTFKLHLPDDWYNDFCGFLICIVTNINSPRIKITMKQEDPPFDLSYECDEVVEPMYHNNMTFVGYVSFSSLRHTPLLTSSYDIVLVTVEDMGYTKLVSYGGIELIPRKSKSDELQTTNFSEFWDKELQDARLNTFTIQQCDSNSFIEISWKPFFTYW